MSARRKRKKRKRPEKKENPRDKSPDPPRKRRKICANESTIAQHNYDSVDNKPTKSVSSSPLIAPQNEPRVVPHISEDIDEEKSTPKAWDGESDAIADISAAVNTNTEMTQLGSLLSFKRPALFTPKEAIIVQLQEMCETGGVPIGLQQQIDLYYYHKANESTSNQKKTIASNEAWIKVDECDVEQTWNCSVLLCCLSLVLMISLLFVLSVTLNAHHIKYCDPARASDYYNDRTVNCTICPQNANCSNGIAKCEWKFILHPVKGCLDKETYEKRINAERLYVMLYHELKQAKRKRYLNCDENIKHVWNKDEIETYFAKTHATKVRDDIDELWILLEEEAYKQEIKECSNGYYVDLPQWEQNATQYCKKFNVLLVAKTYGVELCAAVVCITVLLVSWRKLSMMLLMICSYNYIFKLTL